MDRIPEKALSNIEIESYVKMLNIKHFRGCYMRDELKKLKPGKIECGVLNLNLSNESGSHWTCWFKTNTDKYYFNSFGLPPPKELVDYLGLHILYSTFQLQGMNDQNCGKWCLLILKNLNEGNDYVDLILSLVK
jgi:hypothetical protein